MMIAKIRFGLIVFFISCTVCAGQLYEWVDDKGIKHYSDSPQEMQGHGYQADKEDVVEVTEDANEEEQSDKITKKPKETWQGCDSELCNKVKRIDATCNSSDCVDAKKYTFDCEDIVCKGKKINFEKIINKKVEKLFPEKTSEEENTNKPKKDYTNSTWQGCDSALCNKVKKFDPTCNSSDCISAKKYTYDCEDIICKSKRISFEERIDRTIERGIASKEKQQNKNSYSDRMNNLREEQQKASDLLVVDKCKRERDVFCDKSPEEIRDEYKYR